MKRRVNPETLLTRSIRQALELCGWWTIKIRQGLGSHPGIPDLWVIKNGVVWWIEVKIPGRNLSELQKEFRFQVISRGGNFAVVSSIEELKAFGFVDNLIL